MDDFFTSSQNKVGKPVFAHKGMHAVFGPLSTATKITMEGTVSIKEKETILGIAHTHPWHKHYVVVVRDDCTLRIYKDHDVWSVQPRRPDEAFDLGQAIELEIVEDSTGRHPHRFDLKFGDKFVFSANASTGSELKLWIDGLIQCCPAIYTKAFGEDIPIYYPPGLTVSEPTSTPSTTPSSVAPTPPRATPIPPTVSTTPQSSSTADVESVLKSASQAFSREMDFKLRDFDLKLKPIQEAVIQHTDKLKTISEGVFLIPDQISKKLDEGLSKSSTLRSGGDGITGSRLSIDSTNLVARSVTDSVLDALKSKLDLQNASNTAAAAALKSSVVEHITSLNDAVKRALEKLQTPSLPLAPAVVDSTPILYEVRSVMKEQLVLFQKETKETSSLLTLQSEKASTVATTTADLVKDLSKQVVASSAAVTASADTTKAIIEKNAAELREEVSRRIEDIRANVSSIVMKARDEDLVRTAAGQQQQLSLLLKDLASTFASSSSAASASFMREMQTNITREQNIAMTSLSQEVKNELIGLGETSKKDSASIRSLIDETKLAQKNVSNALKIFSEKQEITQTSLQNVITDIVKQSNSLSDFSTVLKNVQDNTLSVGERSTAAVESIKAVSQKVENALETAKVSTSSQIALITDAIKSLRDLHTEEARLSRTASTEGTSQTKDVLVSLETSNTGLKEKITDLSRAVETASVHNSASVNAVLAHLQSSQRSQESSSSALSSTVKESIRTSHDTLAASLSSQLNESLRSTRDTLLSQLNEALIREQRASDTRASAARDSLADHSAKTIELSMRINGLENASSQVLNLCTRTEAAGAKTAETALQTRQSLETISSAVSSGVILSKDSIEKLVSTLMPTIIQSVSDRLSPEFAGLRDQIAIVESRLDRVADIEKKLGSLVSEIENKLSKSTNDITTQIGAVSSVFEKKIGNVHDEVSKQTGALSGSIEELSLRMGSFEIELGPRVKTISDALEKVDAKMSRIEALETRMAEHFSFLERIDQRTQHAHDTELKAIAKAGAAVAATAAAAATPSPRQSILSPYSSSTSTNITTNNLASPLPSSSSSSFDSNNAPAFIAQMRALRLQSATLQGELSRLTGSTPIPGMKIPLEVRERPEVSAILSRLDQVESLISETRRAMGARAESPYAVSYF
jgi:hypothetical protein